MADKPAVRSLHERFLAIFGAGALKAEGVDRHGAKCELTLFIGGKPGDQHVEFHNDTARVIDLATDLRDPGNGMVALLNKAGETIAWVKKDTARALEVEPAHAHPGTAQALPSWLRIEEGGEVLVVDGVRVARAFFSAIGTHIPLGSCFRIMSREPDGQVHADTVEELDLAVVNDLRTQFDDLVSTIAELFGLPEDEGNEIPVDTLRRIGGELRGLRERRAAAKFVDLGALEADAARYLKVRAAQVHGLVPIVGGWKSEQEFDAAIDRLGDGVALQSIAHPGGGDGSGPELDSGELPPAALEDVTPKPEGGAT